MQAQPQSTPAARVLPAPRKASKDASRMIALSSSSKPRQTVPDAAIPLPAPEVPSDPKAASLAEGAGLAHDAGNLLSALGLYSDLLRAKGVLRPEHAHYAAEISLIASRSMELIDRLLALPPSPSPSSTQSAANAPEFQAAPTRAHRPSPSENAHPGRMHASIMRDLAPILERIAAGSARVTVSSPAALPALDLPAETLERITVNLVRNAAEAIRLKRAMASASAQGEIRVALAVIANRLQLTVEDNGPGLSPAAANAFMHPSELSPSSRNGHGHRIVHELVLSSGGQLSIRVRPGLGTTFCLKWPLPAHDQAPDDNGFTTAFEATFDREPFDRPAATVSKLSASSSLTLRNSATQERPISC